MKRYALLKHLRRYGCFLKREGREHSLWANPVNGVVEGVPRHVEIPDKLARKIAEDWVSQMSKDRWKRSAIGVSVKWPPNILLELTL